METESNSLFEEEENKPDLSQLPYLNGEESQIWVEFENNFLKKPGEHLLGIGITGSGKTQKAYYFAKKLIPYDTLIWFDTGKSCNFGETAEIAPLFTFGIPVNIIIPMGMKINIEGSPVPFTIKEAPRPGDIWDLCEPGMINIVSINPYFIEPELYAKYTAHAFRELIIISKNKIERIRSLLPMSIFHDEFQDVAPSENMTLSASHRNSAKLMAWNINKLRSIGVRICGFSQKYMFIFPNCRIAFTWILCCRGAYFEREDPDLVAFNKMYKRLEIWQAILWFPKRLFQHKWRFRMYQGPEGLKIAHDGIMSNI